MKIEFYTSLPLKYHCAMFGKREIISELGNVKFCDDDCQVWCIASDGDDFMGFSGYCLNKGVLSLKRSYVFPKYRHKGIYREMLKARLKTPHTVAKCTATKNSRHELEQQGFTVTKTFKNYWQYEKSNIH